MQKDFMAMAKGKAAPAPTQGKKINIEDLKKGIPTKEQMAQEGLPTGDSNEEIKQRLLDAFEKIGLMELYDTPEKQQQFAVELNQIIEAYMRKDFKALQQIPLFQTYTQLVEQSMKAQQPAMQPGSGGPVPQGPGKVPKDFTAMMPPTPGGGMNGR